MKLQEGSNFIDAFLLSLNPAIKEEILFRSVFYAFCLSVLNGSFMTTFEKITYRFMMIVPHVLPHTI